MVVSPRYLHGGPSDKNFASASEVGSSIKVYCSGGVKEVAFFHGYRAGVDWVFVDHPSYHRPGNPYGDTFGDNQRVKLPWCFHWERSLMERNVCSLMIGMQASYQWVEPAATYKNLGLPSEWYRALEWVFPTWARTHALDTGKAVNVVKGLFMGNNR